MAIIKDENFILIQGWMINKLKLSGNDLLVYAVIYGFSQDGEQWFEGNRSYLSGWCNSSKRGIQKNLQRLVENKLILKKEVFVNNVKFCKYKVNPKYTPDGRGNRGDAPEFATGEQSSPGVKLTSGEQSSVGCGEQRSLGAGEQSSPNNIYIDNIVLDNINTKKEINKERKEKSSDHFLQNDRVSLNADKKENLDFEKNQVSDSAINVKESNSSNKRLNEEFNQVWDLYPKKQGKKPAQAAFIRARQNGTSLESIISGIKSYLDYIAAKKISQEYVKQGSTFFNQEAWNDDWSLPTGYSFFHRKPNYDIERYKSFDIFESYPSENNERRSEFDQFINPKFNKPIIDSEEEDE